MAGLTVFSSTFLGAAGFRDLGTEASLITGSRRFCFGLVSLLSPLPSTDLRPMTLILASRLPGLLRRGRSNGFVGSVSRPASDSGSGSGSGSSDPSSIGASTISSTASSVSSALFRADKGPLGFLLATTLIGPRACRDGFLGTSPGTGAASDDGALLR